jgi:hypothetical protein
MPISATRTALETALSGIAANVYNSVPESVIPPAIVIVPDSPYIEFETISKTVIRCKLNFTITVAVSYYSNEAALDNLETLLLSVLAALPANYVVGAVDRPSITQVGASDLLVADFNVSTYYTN